MIETYRTTSVRETAESPGKDSYKHRETDNNMAGEQFLS